MMLYKGISTVTMFTFMIVWLSSIINGKLSNSSVVAKDTKENQPSFPSQNDSEIIRYAESKFHQSWKQLNPKTGALATEENRSGNESDVSSIAEPSPEASVNVTSATLKNGAAKSEFAPSIERMAGGELSLFGITNSFINPGPVLSASIENGLQKLSELAGSIGNQTLSNKTSELSPQFFGIGGLSEVSPLIPTVSSPSNPNSQFGTVQNATVAQFFGIANIYVGDAGRSPNASLCPQCPPPIECTPTVEHATLTFKITECKSNATFNSCSLTSVAPTGTLFMLYPFELLGSISFFGSFFQNGWNNQRVTERVVRIRIVAPAADTKLKVTCPSIPQGISVTTQNGSIQPLSFREETGYVELKISGTARSSNVAVACTWEY